MRRHRALRSPQARTASVELTRIKVGPEVLEGIGSAGPRTVPLENVRSITCAPEQDLVAARWRVCFLGPLPRRRNWGPVSPIEPRPGHHHPIHSRARTTGSLLGRCVRAFIGAIIGSGEPDRL